MKKVLTILLAVIVIWGSLPHVAFAASPEHDFDDCTTAGTTITTDCQTGGTGWSGNWTDTTATFDSKTAGCDTSNCIEDDGAGDNTVYRTFAATADGTGSVKVNRTDANVNNFRFNLCADGTTTCSDTGKFYFRLLRSGIGGIGKHVQLGRSGGQTDMGIWIASKWGLIEYDWGTGGATSTCAAGEVRARFNDGDTTPIQYDWTNCQTMNAGNDPGTVEFNTDDTTGGDDIFWDELIVNTAAAAAPAVKDDGIIWSQ